MQSRRLLQAGRRQSQEIERNFLSHALPPMSALDLNECIRHRTSSVPTLERQAPDERTMRRFPHMGNKSQAFRLR